MKKIFLFGILFWGLFYADAHAAGGFTNDEIRTWVFPKDVNQVCEIYDESCNTYLQILMGIGPGGTNARGQFFIPIHKVDADFLTRNGLELYQAVFPNVTNEDIFLGVMSSMKTGDRICSCSIMFMAPSVKGTAAPLLPEFWTCKEGWYGQHYVFRPCNDQYGSMSMICVGTDTSKPFFGVGVGTEGPTGNTSELCVKCPGEGHSTFDLIHGTSNNREITSCYLEKNKEYKDDTGTYVYTTDCYYKR